MALRITVQDHLPEASGRQVDKLSDKRWHSHLMAVKIRSLRKARGLTQLQLADAVGVSEAAIRNYESQKASPKEQHIESIACALGVRPEALRLYDMGPGDSITSNALFQLADTYGLRPHSYTDFVFLEPIDGFMAKMLEAWAQRYEQLCAAEVSGADYQIWKDEFAAPYDKSKYPKRYSQGEDGSMELIDNWEAHCFSAKLRQMRASRDMTQSEFSELIGVKLGVYRSYEQGRRLPRVSAVADIAKRLGVTIGCLTFFDFASPVQAAHALFQLASEYGLRPDTLGGQAILRTQTPGLEQIIDQWASALDATNENGIDYYDWQDHYDPDALDNRTGYISRYHDVFDEKNRYVGKFSDHDPYDQRYQHGYLPA